MCAQKIVAQPRSGPLGRRRTEKRIEKGSLRSNRKSWEELVRPERFELPTCCSGGNRSIQLSYGRSAIKDSLHGLAETPQRGHEAGAAARLDSRWRLSPQGSLFQDDSRDATSGRVFRRRPRVRHGRGPRRLRRRLRYAPSSGGLRSR